MRSVALGAPYFHDGSVATLEEAVRCKASGGIPDPNKTPLMRPTGLTDAEIDKILAFLEGLTSTETWQAVVECSQYLPTLAIACDQWRRAGDI